VPPSAAVELWYERELIHGIRQMNDDIMRSVLPIYRDAPQPILPQTFPNGEMAHALDTLEEKWIHTWDHCANDLVFSFVRRAAEHTDRAFAASLAAVGITLPKPPPHTHEEVVMDAKQFWNSFQMKLPITDAFKKTVKGHLRENVDLISTKAVGGGPSIPAKAFSRIRTLAKNSMEHGRDVVGFTSDLRDEFGITERRASLIARDQNNKMTSQFHQTRQKDCGISKAVWIHTSASVSPREEHEEWDGMAYNVDDGVYSEVDGEQVWPGTPINCGCLSQSIIPGYDE
jgi:hypothetical protein